MSRVILLAAVLCVTSVSVVMRATASAPARQGPLQILKDDPDLPTFERVCSDCHDAQRIIGARRTQVEWEDIINKMIDKGATGSETDFENIFKFVLRNFGRVAINRAPGQEIALVLSLEAKDADAIVAYRKVHGDFVNLDALIQVPGIDTKTITAHKDALVF